LKELAVPLESGGLSDIPLCVLADAVIETEEFIGGTH
jgi:hypothetical protein